MQGSIRSPQLGQEHPQPNEEAMFREMGEIIEKLMIRTRSPVQRQQHAKHHGCVRATFGVEQNLPDELRIGLFKDVTSYPAWVRFSNASQHIDTIGNPHGFALKLMGVTGAKALGEVHDHETQDFLMVDYPIFIVRAASDYLDLFRAALNAPGKMPWSFFFPSLDPSKWRLRELGLIKKMRSLKLDNLLNAQFWTLGAFKFGSGAAKFSVRPLAKIRTPDVAALSPDYLGERLAECLRGQDVQFEFLVQLQTDAKNADRRYHYRMDIAVSSGSDDHDSRSGLSQPGTDRSRGASLVYALARACGASPARWNQSYPQIGLRGVIGGAAPVEWRGRERANLRVRLTLSVIGWQLFSLIARSSTR